MTVRRLLAAATLAVAVTSVPAVGWAQPASPTPAPTEAAETTATSVSLLPRDATADDPHGGTWFLFTLDPGGSGRAVAAVTNTGPVPVTVSLQLRDLTFTEDGTPHLGGADTGLATWGAFETAELEVPPASTVPVAFQLTVPSGTTPGDHLGAAVAVTRSQLDGTEVVQQVATRIVVTVPGDASRSLEITRVELQPQGGILPGPVVARVTVRNTGSIRLAPRVTVADQDASGSRLLTRGTADTYVAEVPVTAFGGMVRLPVVVTDASGVTRRVDESVFLVPWWLIVVLLAAGAGVLAWRGARAPAPDTSVHADVRRLERLVVDVQRRLDSTLGASPVLDDDASGADRVHALELSLVRARRVGEWDVFAVIALALHDLTGDARTALAEAAAADTAYREDLERALAATSARTPAG